MVDERGRANEDIAVIGIPTEGNLLGNLDVTRDEFAGVWAADVLGQLHSARDSMSPGFLFADSPGDIVRVRESLDQAGYTHANAHRILGDNVLVMQGSCSSPPATSRRRSTARVVAHRSRH